MINLTIQSLNNKSISVVDLATNTITPINQSQAVDLAYSNLLLKINTGDTFNMQNVGHVARQIPDDFIYFFVFFGLVCCVVAFAWMWKK